MGDLIPTFSRLVSLLAMFAGIVGVAYFILGAYKYISASGSAQKVEEAKEAMKQSLLGIVFVLIAFTVVNTIVALVGDTTAGLRIDQLVGSESSTLDGPEVVRISAYKKIANTTDRSDGVEIVFNEEVNIVSKDKIHIRSRLYGLGNVISGQMDKASQIRFDHPNLVETGYPDCNAITGTKVYVVEDLLLGSGASIQDEDGNPAIYVFPPTPVILCY